MGSTAARSVYKIPFNPIILRDLAKKLSLTNAVIGEMTGYHQSSVSVYLAKGFNATRQKGRNNHFRLKIEQCLQAMPAAMDWLKERRLTLSDIWKPSSNTTKLLVPDDHGARVRQSRMSGRIERIMGPMQIKKYTKTYGGQKIMSEASRLEILAEYGYSKDPFRLFRMETADYLRLKRVVKMAIDSSAMISVVASWGFGKTSALDLVFREIDAKVVRLQTPDKERVVVSDIEKGLILGLSNESCKRTKEVRARQIRRILGEASKEKPVVLILEEAHRMHSSTLRALKTFREMDWMGRSPLFTVIMVGQYDPMRKRGVDEVRLRTDSVVMKGLTGSEVKDYIKHTVGRHFEEDALEAIARLDESRNFLDLQEIVLNVMRKALENGSKKVTSLEVFEVYGGGIQEVLKRVGLKQSDVEKALGIPKSSLSLALSEKPNTMTPEKNKEIKDAVTGFLKQQLNETSGKGLRVVGGE